MAASPSLEDDLFGDDAAVVTEVPVRAVSEALSASLSENESGGEPTSRKHPLEYLEDDEAPPAPVVEEQTAWLNLVQPPVRRTKPAMLARLPNFVRYSDEPFSAESWSEQQEEEAFRTSGTPYPEIGDKDARSILRTSNTMRWRWRTDGKHTPESNARIVRWSDGSESLQLGSEFFDMTKHAESSAAGPGGSKVPLTYVLVPHAKEGVLQAEGPVRTALTFKPNLHSETHTKLASAIKHHRSARVVATQEFGGLDPEREKERIERQLKDTEKKKQRERSKAIRESHEYDEELDLNMRRHGARHTASRASRTVPDWSDDDLDVARGETHAADYDEDDDGFIVHDETDEDAGEAEASGAEDETDRADRNIEEFERKRRSERETDAGRDERAHSE